MARMFTNSIYYVHEKSNMVELNPSIPVSIPNERADPPETFKQNVDELVTDLVKKAKEIDILIEGLPGIERTEEEQLALLEQLEMENQKENENFEKALQELEEAKSKIGGIIRVITDEQSQP
ncbi:unnamed protein product [Cunninghamella echinulata]